MKYTLLIFGLLWALGASGQGTIFINSYRFGAAPVPQNPLLDDYPNAHAAYSLRLLRTAYTGNCIEVRRSIDNTTSNIGFSGEVIDTAALKTFCASTDCFVRTWYDQSTNTRNATNTTNAQQPRIVASGVIERINGSPAVFFAGGSTAQGLVSGNYTNRSAPVTVFTTHSYFNSATSTRPYVYDLGQDAMIVQDNNGSNTVVEPLLFNGINLVSGLTITYGAQYNTYALFNTTSSAFKINTTSVTGSTGTRISFRITLGTRGGLANASTSNLSGHIQEFILYHSDQSANEGGIRSNMNSFYVTY